MMFCYQCQEAFKGEGCSERGNCGKDAFTSNIMDLLMYTVKGICMLTTSMRDNNIAVERKFNSYVIESLYSTMPYCNYNREILKMRIAEGLKLKMELYNICSAAKIAFPERDEILWANNITEFSAKAATISILSQEPNVEQRSMKAFTLYALKGIATFMYQVMLLGYDDLGIHTFIQSVISDITQRSISRNEWQDLVLLTGQYSMRTLALLDRANTKMFGNPEYTQVNLTTRNKPGILVCGSDIKALKELLEQSQEKGINIYTTSEMVAAHAYPEIRKFSHLAGNYGGSWSSQREVFPAFHGPILFASGSLIPPSLEFSYKERIFTTNVNGCPGCRHIGEDSQGKRDFSELIECAKEYRAPASLERGCINVGMAYNSLKYVSSSILNALNTQDITHLTVIVGSDGRSAMWDFYEKVAKSCPISTLVLCAGDIKYRFNKERFGYVNGIPRLIDAGQINDIFSIIELLLDMKNTLHVNDINKLPVSFYASMHDPRSMATLLALISLGIKGIRVGPLNAPPFCTEKMLKWLNTPKYSSSQIAYP